MSVINSALADLIAAKAPEEHVHLIVRAGALDREVVAQCAHRKDYSVRQHIRMIDAFSLRIPSGQVEALGEEDWVEHLELDKKVYALLDTSVPQIGVPDLWASGASGSGVILAVVDTGIDREHPDLVDRIVAVKDFTLEGFKDMNGHGTHVAGVAAGDGQVSQGTYRGIAPEAQLLGVKVLKGDGTGRMSDVMAGIEWAVDMGAQVINLSLGSPGPGDGQDALSQTCNAAVEMGIVVCVAAGNEGPERGTIGIPGVARKPITVGAFNDEKQMADFSSRGPTADGRLKPDVVAPGVDIIAARAKDVVMGKPLDDNYTSATGTSMATPHVTGICALMLEAKEDASPLLIKEALTFTAEDLSLGDWIQGHGAVSAPASHAYVKTHENPLEEEFTPQPGCLPSVLDVWHALQRRTGR